MTPPATATQTEIPHQVDVDDLQAQLADARATIVELSARIEDLDPADRPDTMDGLLSGAADLLRRICITTGPIELIGTGTRSEIEQRASTALDAIVDAQSLLITPF